MQFDLKNKTALVTGGSRGLGLEIARALLEQGATVFICSRKQANLDQAAEALGHPEQFFTIQAHIGKPQEVDQMFETIDTQAGCLDILINNVGMNLITPGVANLDPGLWQKIMETNLTGTFLVSRRAAAMMRTKNSGKIVSISSIAGRKATPGMGIYGIAKAGIEMLTKVLAAELAMFNIQVNALAPAMVKTKFSEPFWSNEELLAHVTSTIPMGRIADPKDLVNPVLFLASEGTCFITGQTLVADGGATII
ncbi:MAG: SDR family oxidoreductase [Desulfobacter sp.]|nr:SDR family oxidoreductase [Desulfobacter sp.]WDP86505.1 MAG: SDR family oxidoreductase [Desulfobacter sp.]